MIHLDVVICPGCNTEIPKDNDGCPICFFEVDSEISEEAPYRIPPLRWWMNENQFELNNVSPAFIKRLLLEASCFEISLNISEPE